MYNTVLLASSLWLLLTIVYTQSLLSSDYSLKHFHGSGQQVFSEHETPQVKSNILGEDKYVVKTPEDLYGPLNYSDIPQTLVPLLFEPLPLGSIKAKGWLRNQLTLISDGLPGHMHDFYRHVKQATWLGGDSEYSDRNEAWPYYLNGIVPLVYGLEDNHHRARHLRHVIRRQVREVLAAQHEDGWLGPEIQQAKRNLWARFPLFLAFTQLVEANEDDSETKMIIKSMHRFIHLMHKMLKDNHQGYVEKPGDEFEDHWARTRAADMILSLQWMYEKHPGDVKKKIHESMLMLYEQSFDWTYWWRDDVFVKENLDALPRNLTDRIAPYIHSAHAAVGLKYGAVMHRLLHEEQRYQFLNSTHRGLNYTFAYHGTQSGSIIADERMSGLSPSRGTELCAVVETMFSLSQIHQVLGDNKFVDHLELTAFNALPAMVMPRWWAHQYNCQTNQPYSHELREPPFWNIGEKGVLFGLEPVYPCCTVQMSQGYPKMLAGSWLRTKDGGIAHVILVPSEIRTTLEARVSVNRGYKKIKNQITISCKTNYPFAFMFEYTIHATHPFSFAIRIPSWVDTESANDKPSFSPASFYHLNQTTQPHPMHPNPHTGLHTISLPAGKTTVELILSPTNPKKPKIQHRANSTIAITHGPLLYALSPHEIRTTRRPENYPGDLAPPEANDWTITPRDPDEYPWNLALDPSTLRFFAYDNRYDEQLAPTIWDQFAPPVSITGLACPVNWSLTGNGDYESESRLTTTASRMNVSSGGWAPNPPLPGPHRKCIGRAFPVELRPYGSAKIHVAEFPTVDLSPGSKDLWDPSEEARRQRTEKSEL